MFDSPFRTHEVVRHKCDRDSLPQFLRPPTTANDCHAIATGKTCMKWTIASVLRSTCVLFQRKLFFLPEAAAKICKLPVAIVWRSLAVVGGRKNWGREPTSSVLTGLSNTSRLFLNHTEFKKQRQRCPLNFTELKSVKDDSSMGVY